MLKYFMTLWKNVSLSCHKICQNTFGTDNDNEVQVDFYMNLNSKYFTISILDEGHGFDANNSHIENYNRIGGNGVALLNYFCTPGWNKKGNVVNLNMAIT